MGSFGKTELTGLTVMNLGLGEGRDKEQSRLQKLQVFYWGWGLKDMVPPGMRAMMSFSISLKGTGRNPMASEENKTWQESTFPGNDART